MLTLTEALAQVDHFYATQPGFIGPRTQGDLLTMAGCAIVKIRSDRYGRPEYECVELEGWSGSVEASDIIVVWTEQCQCQRPCCKGEYRTSTEIGWDAIMALYADANDDQTLWDDQHAWYNFRDSSDYVGY